jgi:hypothetical protein
MICRNIRENLDDPMYADKVVKLFRSLHFSMKDLTKMVELGEEIVNDDNELFSVDPVNTVPEVVSPTCKDKFEKGLRIGSLKIPNITLKTLVVPGNIDAKYDELFYVKNVGDNNPHGPTSHLKHYLEALIVDNKINTMNLIGLEHYNNKCDGPSVIIAPFATNVLMSKFPAIQATHLPVLALVTDFKPGMHIGNMYTYFCDAEGHVKGVHKGSNYWWYDSANKFKAAGNHGSYKYTTLATYGDQRMIYFHEGMHAFETELRAHYAKTWKSLRKEGDKVKWNYPLLDEPPEPRRVLGVYDMIPEEKNPNTVTTTQGVNYPDLGEEPWYVKTYRCVRRRMGGILLSTGTGLLLPTTSKKAKTIGATLVLAGAIIEANKLWKQRKIKVTYNLQPLQFKGKHREKLEHFYAEHPVDVDAGIPYGNFWVDNYTISQVSQKGLCNYTNIYKLITNYAVSIGAGKTAAPGIYLESVPSSAPTIVKPNDGTFHTAALSPLPRVTAACEYSVHVKDQFGMIGVHLLNPQKFRQFIASAINHDVVAATASNRVVCESIKPKLTRSQFYRRYVNLWKKHKLPRRFYIDNEPNLNYTGKKLKRYLAVLQYYGARAVCCVYETFLKKEALPESSFTKKAVRLISPNSPLFLIATKNFFTKFEELLLTMENQFGIHVFAKHRTIHERWKDILELKKHFRYVYCGDAKNFDASHRNDSFLAEVDFYEWLFLDTYLANLMRIAKTFGVIWHTIPMRHSGDLCTGSGNCLTVAACASTLPGDIVIYCDGDDTLFFSNDEGVEDIIKQHFDESGFTMELEEPIDLNKENWEIEFCHVFYSKRGYSYDCERMLNRFGNIVGDNYNQLANTILGKIQALPILEAAGCDFGFSVRELVRGDPENSRDKYTMDQFAGMENYLPDRSQDIDMNDPNTGFIAKVLRYMRDHKFYFSLLSDRRWKSKLLKAIARMLEEEAAKQTFDLKQLKSAERLVETAGLKAMTPVLTQILTAQAMKAYGMEERVYTVDAQQYLEEHGNDNVLGHLCYQVDVGAIKNSSCYHLPNGRTADVNLQFC